MTIAPTAAETFSSLTRGSIAALALARAASSTGGIASGGPGDSSSVTPPSGAPSKPRPAAWLFSSNVTICARNGISRRSWSANDGVSRWPLADYDGEHLAVRGEVVLRLRPLLHQSRVDRPVPRLPPSFHRGLEPRRNAPGAAAGQSPALVPPGLFHPLRVPAHRAVPPRRSAPDRPTTTPAAEARAAPPERTKPTSVKELQRRRDEALPAL